MKWNRLRPLVPPALAVLVLLAGCTRGDHRPAVEETTEPEYQRGQQLEKQGKPQEALAAYLKVIAQRGEDASPESHLEAGVIYRQHVKDPLEAIRHFKKYLELEPNSRQAGLVRQQIDAAKRDFARTLLAQPLDNPSDRMQLQAQIAGLQRENDELRAELSALRGGGPVTGFSPGAGNPVAFQPPVNQAHTGTAPPMGDLPVTLMATNPVATNERPAPIAPPRAAPRAAAPKSPAPGAGGQKYTVQPKDTLFKIAQRYPGAGGSVSARVQAIFGANRDVMKTDTDLRPGMELRIP